MNDTTGSAFTDSSDPQTKKTHAPGSGGFFSGAAA